MLDKLFNYYKSVKKKVKKAITSLTDNDKENTSKAIAPINKNNSNNNNISTTTKRILNNNIGNSGTNNTNGNVVAPIGIQNQTLASLQEKLKKEQQERENKRTSYSKSSPRPQETLDRKLVDVLQNKGKTNGKTKTSLNSLTSNDSGNKKKQEQQEKKQREEMKQYSTKELKEQQKILKKNIEYDKKYAKPNTVHINVMTTLPEGTPAMASGARGFDSNHYKKALKYDQDELEKVEKELKLRQQEENKKKAKKVIETAKKGLNTYIDLEKKGFKTAMQFDPVFGTSLQLSNKLKDTDEKGKKNKERKTNKDYTKESGKWYENIVQKGALKDGVNAKNIAKTITATGADITQDLVRGLGTIIEAPIDIGANIVATGANLESKHDGSIIDKKKLEKISKSARNFADKDLAENTSRHVQNPFSIAYNFLNGTPEKIINPAGIKWDKNKSAIDNYVGGLKKTYIDDPKDEDYAIEKDSASGTLADEGIETLGYMFGLALGDSIIKNSGGNPNVDIKIKGKDVIKMPKLAFVGGTAGGLKEANATEDTTELQRWVKAIGSGGIESFTEGMFSMFGVGGSELDDVVGKKATDIFNKSVFKGLSNRARNVGKLAANQAVKASGESFEEVASNGLNYLLDNYIVDKLGKGNYKKDFDWNQLWKEAGIAFVTTLISQGGSSFINMNSAIKNAEKQKGSKLTLDERASVASNVIDKAIIGTHTENERNVIDKITEERTKENSTNAEKKQIRKQVERELERGYIDLNDIEKVFSNKEYTNYTNLQNEKTSLQDELNELNDKKYAELTVKEADRKKSIENRLDTIDNDINNAKRVLNESMVGKITNYDTLLQNVYAQEAEKGKAYAVDENVEQTESDKIINEDLKKIGANNSIKTRDLADLTKKVSNNAKSHGWQYRFVNDNSPEVQEQYNNLAEKIANKENISLEEAKKRVANKTINGFKDDATKQVFINIDSNEIMSFVVGHETMHVLEGSSDYKALKDLAIEYSKAKGTYETLKASKKGNYDSTELEEEISADVIGDLFTDIDFVRQMSTQQPSVFEKAYKTVKHLYKMATADSAEARQLEKLKYNFDKVYNEYKKSNKSTTSENTQNSTKSLTSIEKIKKISKWALDKTGKLKSFKQQIKEYQNNKIPTGTQLIVSENNEGLEYAEVNDNPIVMKQSTLKKYSPDGKHSNIDFKIIENIDKELKTSVFAMDSINNNNAKIIVLDETTSNGRPIIATIIQDKSNANVYVNEITSVYDKKEFQNFINRTIESGKNIYTNEKTNNWLLRNRHQLPTRFTNSLVGNSVPQNSKNVNDSNVQHSISEKGTLAEGVEKQGMKIMEQAIADENSMIENFKTYLEENDIENPTQEDIDNSFSDYTYEAFDNDLTQQELKKAEDKYNKVIANYLYEDLQKQKRSLETRLKRGQENYSEYARRLSYTNDSETRTRFEQWNNDIKETRDKISKIDKQIKEFKKTHSEELDDGMPQFSISDKDSNGRTLTKQQQEYFKDSKVVDDEGNLIVAHHGTDTDFNTFRHEFIGDDNKDGFGFYFTPNELKFDYDYKKSVYLDIKNPATTSEQIGEILRRQNELYDTIKNKEEVLKQIQKEFEVDGIIDSERNNIVAFNSNQIKSVDNTNPTTNEDIRYSISEKDNKGRTLTKEQQEYFKDSVIKVKKGEYGLPVISEDGQLFEMYHGTPNGDFTVFDKNMAGTSHDTGWYGPGFYFAFTEGEAKYYGPNVIKAYLNITKPFVFDEEMNAYDGKTSGDVMFDFGSFMINMKNKFSKISNNEKLSYSEYSDKTGDYEHKEVSIKELGDKIEEVYNSDNLKLITINDNGVDKYQYIYQTDINKYKVPTEIKNIIEKGHIYNKQDAKFAVENNQYYKQTPAELQKVLNFYNNNDVDFSRTYIGHAIENKSTMEDSRLSEATWYVTNNIYKHLDMHIPEYYMQYLGSDIQKSLIEQGYDGVLQSKYGDEAVAFYPNQIKRVDNTKPTSDPDIRYSMSDNNNIAPINKDMVVQDNEQPIAPIRDTNKTMNPAEISNLSVEDADTTPALPNIKRNNNSADKESKFYKNATETSKFLTEDSRNTIGEENDVKYYKGITNKDTLDEAKNRLDTGGASETLNWLSKESKKATAVDVAEGWVLLKQYQDAKDYDSMVEVAKKMREIGTIAGQTVQAYNIMERLTPEGMVKYAQSELQEAYDNMVKNKTKEWIDKHRSDFDLTPDEVQFIVDNMNDMQNIDDEYQRKVKLAEIQKVITDKLPSYTGKKIKTWMRISMLFNPKTQVRNVMGNAMIAPVNYFGDMFASYADKIVAKKTGVRTTGNMNIKAILKGMKEGTYQATNDYKKGINTRDMAGDRFEIGEGKSFSDSNIVGKSINRVDAFLTYIMDVGDRIFSQSSFENSLQNQMILNNTKEITPDMIDIARQESLQRTWNDNNEYTRFVLRTRRGINKLGINGYGLGDVLVPFAKTPANLTKAIYDFSPAGLVSSIVEMNNLKKAINNGQYTPQMQHKAVQDLGRATAGTMLYILGYALAKAKIVGGDSDDDKDTANFLKNTLGVSSYSIKIGGKTFTYDWAQPLAAPLSIMANIVGSKNKDRAALESIVSSLDSAGSILLEQSFLRSINEVLTDNDGVVSGLFNQVLDLPSRTVPTFVKQFADMVDGTARQTFEYNAPLKTAVNKALVKIPIASKKLAPSVDTMGREIQKYGGKNNIFNVFLNPANVNTENISESAGEIYRLYKETGDKNVMPRVVPYYLNKNGEKKILTSYQKAEYQKQAGKIVEDNVKKLMGSEDYNNMSDLDKAEVIKNIVNFSYNAAQKEVLGEEISKSYRSAYVYSKIGDVGDYYIFKYNTYNMRADKDKKGNTITGSLKKKVKKYVEKMNTDDLHKAILFKMKYNSYEDYDSEIVNYIANNDNISYDETVEVLDKLGFRVTKNGNVKYKK